MTSCSKPDFNRLATIDEIDIFVDKLQQAGKIDNLQQVYGLFGCVK